MYYLLSFPSPERTQNGSVLESRNRPRAACRWNRRNENRDYDAGPSRAEPGCGIPTYAPGDRRQQETLEGISCSLLDACRWWAVRKAGLGAVKRKGCAGGGNMEPAVQDEMRASNGVASVGGLASCHRCSAQRASSTSRLARNSQHAAPPPVGVDAITKLNVVVNDEVRRANQRR